MEEQKKLKSAQKELSEKGRKTQGRGKEMNKNVKERKKILKYFNLWIMSIYGQTSGKDI